VSDQIPQLRPSNQFLFVLPQTPDSRHPRPPTVILTLVVGYAALSALWILLSDRLVTWLFPEPAMLDWAQTVKGWLFVAITAVLLYQVLRRLESARDAAQERETEALRAEARSGQLLHTLVEHSSDAIFVKDRAGRYLLFNREATRVIGRDAASVLGSNDHAVFPAEQAAMIRANDERVMAQAQAQTFE
jgi:PAS domain-containing protein